jgi:thioredoxin
MKYILTLTLAILLIACKTQSNGGLTPTDFNKQITSEEVKLIDVRTPEEYNEGYIKGAINIDWNAGDFETAMTQFGKDQKIFLYCKSGTRSGHAFDLLKKLGYKNVYNLNGGISAWKAAQLPVETKASAQAATKPEEGNPIDFKTAIYGDKLVFVDFNAVWCGPCRRMQPFVDIIKEERSSDVLVYSIDTDKEVALAQEYQIFNLPTVILLKKGAVLYRKEGYHDQKMLNDLVTKYK